MRIALPVVLATLICASRAHGQLPTATPATESPAPVAAVVAPSPAVAPAPATAASPATAPSAALPATDARPQTTVREATEAVAAKAQQEEPRRTNRAVYFLLGAVIAR
jgi:hypothetical protein